MGKLTYYKIGGKLHRVKLIGAFVVLVALLMFIKASADMWESWDAVKSFEGCMETVGRCDTAQAGEEVFAKQDPCEIDEWQKDYDACRADLRNSTGLNLQTGKAKLSWWQFVSALMQPMAAFFFWLAVLMAGWLVYISGRIAIPIVQAESEIKKKK